ncbi:hypothetical protein FQ142_01245 [Microbacterium sp. ANT_H45B]|nr:hypothetical protein FQ142_01245 [Microbacterium sp. ANT_H45B]
MQYPRELSLAVTVSAEIPMTDLGDVAAIGSALTRAMRRKEMAPAGPLIQHTAVTIDGTRNFVMRQTRAEEPREVPGYVTSAAHALAHCVLARFEGDASELGIVYSAIAVYAYEHEIDLTGEFHLVFVEQVDLEVTVDVFASTAETHA